ncbi:MAG: TRAP transporter large permease subunit [Oligoflexia bacterium]|nr:TRAP transporter large permease subunit [Oligoflexia bacterium]
MLATTIYLLIAFLAIIGTPLFVIMVLFAMVAFTFADISISSVSIAIYQVAAQPMMLSIPLFTFAGYLIAESKSPQRLMRLGQALLGQLPGGVAIICLSVSAIFTAFTGASGVTIIALGGLMYPLLRNEGYSERFALGLITTCGSLGLLFAPSLPIILYGLISRTDINSLFKAGPVPGLFLIIVLSLYAIFTMKKIRKNEEVKRKKFDKEEAISAIKGAFFEILLPVGVLVGIYGGITTVTEAASFTALYVFILACFIHKDVPLKNISQVVLSSTSLVGAILLMVCSALALTNYLVDEEIPMKLLALIKTYISNKYIFLIALNLFLVLVGCMMDIFSAIVIVVPLIAPMALEYGINPVHLAIIFLTNLEIGYLTPPVGINLFISSFRFKQNITVLYRSVLPFILLLWGSLIVITYCPQLSTWLQ